MQVFVNIKSAGKRKNILTKKAYDLPEELHTLRDLLTCFTRQEVEAYNRGDQDKRVPILSEEELFQGREVGKISFGERQTEKQADPDEAVEVTISSWQDGLVRVFVNDQEAEELDGEMNLQEGDTLTFIRLTFLSGRMW